MRLKILTESIKKFVTIDILLKDLGLSVPRSNFIKSIYKEEKTPSLRIYPETNSYYCFATNQGGDVIKFYMHYLSLDFNQAIEELSRKYLHTVTRTPRIKKKMSKTYSKSDVKVLLLKEEEYYFHERAAVYEYDAGIPRPEAERLALNDLSHERFKISTNIYSSMLCNFGLTDSAFTYLTSSKRKLNESTISKFRLFSINKTTREFLFDNYSIEDLVIAGLFSRTGRFIFENHQLIIPYIENNQVVYLRARRLDSASSNKVKPVPKYMCLFNTLGNHRAKRFYNRDVLTTTLNTELIITEGEFDCMAADKNGLTAIGIPGVSNFPIHDIALLQRFEIYFAFDNDEAGEKAVQKYSSFFNRKCNQIRIVNGKDLTEAL